jgi:hypothetical protein
MMPACRIAIKRNRLGVEIEGYCNGSSMAHDACFGDHDIKAQVVRLRSDVRHAGEFEADAD